MDRFTASIRQAVEQKNWFGALFLALAVPDVCGALESPDAKVGERYRDWFNRYLKKQYDPDTMTESMAVSFAGIPGMQTSLSEMLKDFPAEVFECMQNQKPPQGTEFTAEDCYRLRCRCLHQGLPEKLDAERIHFSAPDPDGRIYIHKNLLNGVFQLSIDVFCLDICNAVDAWLKDVSGNKEVQNRMTKLIEVYDLRDHRLPIVGPFSPFVNTGK